MINNDLWKCFTPSADAKMSVIIWVEVGLAKNAAVLYVVFILLFAYSFGLFKEDEIKETQLSLIQLKI